MGINVGTATAFLMMDMSGFQNSLASAGADLRNFATGGGMQSLTSAMNNVGSELTKKVTLPIAGIGAVAANASMDFEAQMSKVKAISGATGQAFDDLRDQAIQLGADTSFSASAAANGMENLASAGFNNNEIMKAMPGMLDLAAAGGVEISVAADIAGSSLRGFGMEAEQVTHVADVLAKVAGATNAGITDTGEAMKYVAPVSKALGISFEETSAAIGLLSNAGIKGGQAGTVLRGALTNLAAPTDKSAKVMKELGMTFFDTHGKMLPMSSVLGILKDKTAGLTQQQKASTMETLFGKEAMSGMLALVDQGPDKLKELGTSLKNCDGASKEMAATMQDNLKGSIEAMKGSIETAAIKIGDVLSPMIKGVAEKIADLVNKFSALPKGTQEFIVKIALLAASVGPVLLILAKLITSVKTVITAFSSISKIGSIISALPALIGSPVLIVIGIIAGIATVVFLVIKNWDKLKAYFGGFWNFVKNVFSDFWEWLKSFFGKWGPMILAILAPFLGIPLLIIKHWDKIKAALSNVFEGLKSGFQKVIDFFMNGFKGLKQFFTDTIGFFKNIGGFIIDGLLGGITEKWGALKDKFSGMANMIKSVFARGVDAHSPSRDFIKFGSYIGDGLVIGLDQQEEGISKKMNTITSKIKSIGNVSPELNKLNNMNVSGNYNVNSKGVGGGNNKNLNFTPNITMHVTIADTGAKGTEQLTSEVKDMTKTAMKNGMIDMFMKDVTSSY